MHMTNLLSVGLPSTLGSYLRLTKLVFGEDSPAVVYLNEQIAEAPAGAEEEVLAAESQMLYVISEIHRKGYKK